MASISHSYNPDAEPSSGYTPLPAGEYQMEIVESDYRLRKGGAVLICKAQIVGGEHEGRPYWLTYNLENDDEMLQGRDQLAFEALCRVTGVMSPEDTAELHHEPFTADIGIRPHRDTGEPENFVRKYILNVENLAA